jgi:hypothetical protein
VEIRALAIVVAISVATAANSQQPAAAGSLTGCVTDVKGKPLPGVTVDVSTGSVHRLVTSGPDGCYELPELPAGGYVVFARLPGFASYTRDVLQVPAGKAARLDFQMDVHAICECVGPPSTLASLSAEADAVVHLRISGHERARPVAPAERKPYFAHRADVVRVLKPHARLGTSATSVAFLQPSAPLYAEQEPYAVGQEFVIFLDWLPPQKQFVRLDVRPGAAAAAFAIENGRIRSAGIEGFTGRPLDFLLLDLAPLMKR